MCLIKYAVNIGAKGQGYGTEMVAAAVDHLMSLDQVKYIRALPLVENTASINILTKLNFVRSKEDDIDKYKVHRAEMILSKESKE